MVSVSTMSDYDIYTAVCSIANAIVKQSKGLGYTSFDAEILHKDVDRGQDVFNIAKGYMSAGRVVAKAEEKIRACKTLELPTKPYELERDAAQNLKEFWLNKMKEILLSDDFVKSYHGEWLVRS